MCKLCTDKNSLTVEINFTFFPSKILGSFYCTAQTHTFSPLRDFSAKSRMMIRFRYFFRTFFFIAESAGILYFLHSDNIYDVLARRCPDQACLAVKIMAEKGKLLEKSFLVTSDIITTFNFKEITICRPIYQ